MGVPNSDIGYTSAMRRREDHEVHKDMWGHWEEGGTFIFCLIIVFLILSFLEIRAERRQKSISVEFSFATVFAFKHHVSAA